MASRIAEYSILGGRPTEGVNTARDAHGPEEPLPHQTNSSRHLQFLVSRESMFLGFWRSLAVLFSRAGSPSFHGPVYFFRNARVSQFRVRPRSFSASVLFHCSMVLLLVYFPHVVPAESSSDIHREVPPREEVYFRIPLVDTAKPLPRMAAQTVSDPAKPTASIEPPASSPAQSDDAKTESTASYGSLTIVSKPTRPDNFHQTIIQPLSPPDLKITSDVKVPNIVLVLGKQPDIVKPAFPSTPNDTKPMVAMRQIASVAAPSVAPQKNPVLPQSDAPEIAKPGYTVTPDSKPVVAKRQIASVAAPSVGAREQDAVLPLSNPPDIAKPTFPMTPNDTQPVAAKRQMVSLEAPSVGTVRQDAVLASVSQGTASGPRPPMPTVTPSTPIAKRSNGTGQTVAPMPPTLATSAGKVDLVAIGINAADPSSEIALPPGNRSGEFTITPAGSSVATGKTNSGGHEANPGQALEPTARGGSSGTVGKGTEGALSIVGPGISGDGNGMLDPALGASLVFPVPSELLPKQRQNHLVVSAGPIGGGGLNVYGAMQCGRIYTVFLEMPKDNWTLQYCEKKAPGTEPTTQGPSNVVHLETPLTPPDAQARFDFQRLPVAPEKAHKSIILKGIIREDGSVDQVQVYQGILPQMDEAARLALSQWKFKPALREGKPVPLEILVGIPPTATTNR